MLGQPTSTLSARVGGYIAVGGPAKANNLAKFGQKTSILKWCADKAGVRAKMYLAEGTPQSVIEIATKWLGSENVIIFK